MNWLRDGKAEFSKIEIDVKSEGNRGLRAKTQINVLKFTLNIQN